MNGAERFSAVTGERMRVLLFPTFSGAVGLIGSTVGSAADSVADSAGSCGLGVVGKVGSTAVLCAVVGTVTAACALESLIILLLFGIGPMSCFDRGTFFTGSTKVVRPLAPFHGSRYAGWSRESSGLCRAVSLFIIGGRSWKPLKSFLFFSLNIARRSPLDNSTGGVFSLLAATSADDRLPSFCPLNAGVVKSPAGETFRNSGS